MTAATAARRPTYQERIEALRETKLAQTREKQRVIGSMDYDDWSLILPPPDRRKVVQIMGPSGLPITDCLLAGFELKTNHPSGGFFGPRATGANFRALLECHPVYLDPMSSLAGGYMASFFSYRNPHWNPDLDYPHLRPGIEKYRLTPGIGAVQHFCQDLGIGLELGWGGILAKIGAYRAIHPESAAFYDGLEDVARGIRGWIGRHAEAALAMAAAQENPLLAENLRRIADINGRLVDEPPRTFREACQWILWFQLAARMYNNSGSLGRMDELLEPFYERDTAEGRLDDEEAVFHLACLLVRDTGYSQLGGPDGSGRDVTGRLSYLVLEAAHRMRVPANIGVCVGRDVDPGLLARGVELLFADRTGFPKFLGIDRTVEGFRRNGYSGETARRRAYSGCHWSGIPGREYTLNDCVKINFARVFEVAFREMTDDPVSAPSTEELWRRFQAHLRAAVRVTAEALDFHCAHMRDVFPELVLDLLCHGPIERGLDASAGGVEMANLCVDGSALANAADSFAAVEQRVEKEGRVGWRELRDRLDADWAGPEGERTRLLMRGVPRYGAGGTPADAWAVRIAEAFTAAVKERPTPEGRNMVPGIFSWAANIVMGKDVGATPDGRKAGSPISHGANPTPGFRKSGAPTALAKAVASVQSGWGNTTPLQIDLDAAGPEAVEALIRTHFELGGTQVNINVVDAARIRAAAADPSLYPDLIVRVTGFSAYFASLSPEFRRMVADRVLALET